MKLTKREKKLLYKLLKTSFSLQALSSEWESDDQEACKENYGMTLKSLVNTFDRIVDKIEVDVR